MTALITGASSGIGESIAFILSDMGYDLILVARNEKKLRKMSELLNTNADIISVDLSCKENCFKLFDILKNKDIDILVNNAGYGIFGEFDETDISDEIDMISLNVLAVHILTKLFIKKFKERDKGYILNVASSAGFFSGPLLSSYYASKSYVLRLTIAIYEELRKVKSNVSISVLCPGPVETGFNDRAGVKFAVKGKLREDVARYAIKKMFCRKLIIVPGAMIKFSIFVRRFFSEKFLAKICYYVQRRKKD